MKKYFVAAAFVLGACQGAQESDEPVAEETAVVDTVQVVAADGQPPEGTYEVTLPDGTVWTEVVNADGTYTSSDTAGNEETGTWRVDGPNRWCSKASDEEQETCRAETIGEDGVWTSVSEADEADTVTVVRVQ